jgi:Uma2 family endonuclease
MATKKTLVTADDLLHMPDDDMRHELVRGELRTMPPAGGEHGWIAGLTFKLISDFVDARRLGWTFAAETGFHIARNPDIVRAADVAFVSSGRFATGHPPREFPDLAPDFVVEVMSPGDSNREVEEKVRDWLDAGVRLVWIMRPARRTLAVHTASSDVRVLQETDVVDGGNVLPGFSCPVRDLFGG